MKPYVCGDDGVYIPDTNCNCTSADAISVNSPIEIAGEEVELANLQENLDLLLEEIDYLYSQGGSSESPWFYAGITNDTIIPAWTETRLSFVGTAQSANSGWDVDNGYIVYTESVNGTYEVSAMVTLMNNATDSNFVATMTVESGGTTANIAASTATFKGATRGTAVISPMPLTVDEGAKLTLTVNSGVGATAQIYSTHIFIRKIADAVLR